jgi:3-hydroxypropanoate dehydrogenase
MMQNQTTKQNTISAKASLSEEALNQLFRDAHTHSAWRSEPVPVELVHKIYDLARLGPTSANGSPGRFLFLTTPEAKERLKPALMPSTSRKTVTAPVTAIIAWDTEFHENLPRLFPHADMRSYFIGNQPLINETAFRNSSLFHSSRAGFGTGLRSHVWL